jgi:squalene-associated FAD-dependent desaturase
MSQVVHILGGGLAGLAAALRLSKYGFHPVIIEKNHYLGGRVRSFMEREMGDEIDNGQHLLMSNCVNLIRFLKEVGAEQNIEFQKDFLIPFWVNTEGSIEKKQMIFPALPYPFHLILGGIKTNLFDRKEKWQLLKLLSLRNKNPVAYQGRNAYTILKELNQSDSLIHKFWEPFLVSTFNSPMHSISGPAFINLLQETIVNSGKMLRLGFPRTGLTSSMIRPAEKYLISKNTKFLFKTLIQGMEFDAGKKIIKMLIDHEGQKIPVERLIVAIPQRNLLKILPLRIKNELWRQNVKLMEYSPILSIYVWTKKAFTHESHIAFIGSPIHWLFNKRVYGGPIYSDYFVYQLTISAGFDLVDRVPAYIKSLVLDELERFFPDFNRNSVIKIRVIKEKLATPLASSHNEKLRVGPETPYKNLLLAGDWTNTNLPYTMESAVKSGFKAAEKIINADYFEAE